MRKFQGIQELKRKLDEDDNKALMNVLEHNKKINEMNLEEDEPIGYDFKTKSYYKLKKGRSKKIFKNGKLYSEIKNYEGEQSYNSRWPILEIVDNEWEDNIIHMFLPDHLRTRPPKRFHQNKSNKIKTIYKTLPLLKDLTKIVLEYAGLKRYKYNEC